MNFSQTDWVVVHSQPHHMLIRFLHEGSQERTDKMTDDLSFWLLGGGLILGLLLRVCLEKLPERASARGGERLAPYSQRSDNMDGTTARKKSTGAPDFQASMSSTHPSVVDSQRSATRASFRGARTRVAPLSHDSARYM